MKLKVTFIVILILGFVYLGISNDEKIDENQDLSQNPEYIKINSPFDIKSDSIIIDGVTYPGANLIVKFDKEPRFDLSKINNYINLSLVVDKKKLNGRVLINMLISKDGKLIKEYVKEGNNLFLNDNVLKAMYLCYKDNAMQPAILKEMPIDCWIAIPIHFGLR